MNHLVAKRYARGLSEAIPDTADLEEALKSLEDMCDTYGEHPTLRTLLETPAVGATTREKILEEVLNVHEMPLVAKRFVLTLFKRHRINLLREATSAFGVLVDQRLNRVVAHVTTALELSPGQEEKLRAKLSTYSDSTVRLEKKVDKEIIGGVVVRLGGTVLDGSLRAQLNRVKESLLAEER